MLNELTEKKITRPELRAFKCSLRDRHVPSWVLKYIFLVFPSIKHFNVGPTNYSSQMRKSIIPRLSSFVHHFMQLENLTFNILSDGSWIKLWNSQMNSELRLVFRFLIFDFCKMNYDSLLLF